MKVMYSVLLAAAVAVMGAPQHAQAGVISTLSSWDGGGLGIPFGGNNISTIGQTFTAQAGDTSLDSFTFWLDENRSPVDFEAYVMSWSGDRASGDVLYRSSVQSTANSGESVGMEAYSFNTGGVDLLAGQTYVAFLSTSNLTAPTRGTAQVGYAGEAYSGGSLVFVPSRSSFDALTTRSWVSRAGDAAFVANFSESASESLSAHTPEPTSLAVWGIGLACLTVGARRRLQ